MGGGSSVPVRVTLDILDGLAAGKRLTVASGQKALIGRASWAELSVPSDPDLSGRHFTLECDESRCLLRDFKGSNGTHLNGGRVAESVLRDGDRILAGQTTFVVHIGEGEAPPPPAAASATPAPPAVSPTRQRGMTVEELLRSAQPLYAVLDTAREPRTLELLRESKAPFESLYGDEVKGRPTRAPYLVALPPDSPLLPTLAAAWGQGRGIYLTCDKPLADVRAHLREFIQVQTPDGKLVFFRFYEPCLLRAFLPVCDRPEIAQFFGPIRAFLLEGEEPSTALRFLPDKPRVRMESVPLS
jgi:pSer/pThr/pTyr-binding forkhead associated (FHA) protein